MQVKVVKAFRDYSRKRAYKVGHVYDEQDARLVDSLVRNGLVVHIEDNAPKKPVRTRKKKVENDSPDAVEEA